jgi:hypothetical protein
MGRRWKVWVAVLVIAGGWLVFSKDPTRERVIHSVADLANRAVTSKAVDANWGDVAKKIGDFASEERGLKDSVNHVEKATPPAGP